MKTSKLLVMTTTLLATSTWCSAQDLGRVLSSTPVMQQVGIPRQVCSTEQVEVQPHSSGGGAMLGALAGGALGNALGSGHGRAAATVVGAIGGAILGDRVEGEPPSYLQNVQRCSSQTFFESRVVAYNVVYEFAGKQHSVQMPHDPGSTIQLQVSPVGSAAQNAQPPVSYQYQSAPVQPVVVQPAVVVTQPAYPIYYPGPYYSPPVAIGLSVGPVYRYHHHYGHWR